MLIADGKAYPMAYRDSLPSLRLGAADWADGPPHPHDAPLLYEGLLWRRILAYGIDVVAIAVLSVAAWVAAGILGLMTFGLLWPVAIVALALIPATYHTFFLGSRGATPGMRLLDLEMWSLTGRQPEYLQAFLATVLFYVSVSMTASLILIVALFNDRRRTLHDVLAGTLVLRRIPPGSHSI
jgi:uncharacterized RDD family membrane protein YckC